MGSLSRVVGKWATSIVTERKPIRRAQTPSFTLSNNPAIVPPKHVMSDISRI